MTDPETYAAFVSHASEDRPVAEELTQLLEARGLRCWIAYRDIPPLSDYVRQINDGLRRSRCLVLLYSDAANRSQNVRSELEIAWRLKKPIYTVKLEDVPLSETIAYYVQFTQWIDAWDGRFADHVELLRRALESPNRGIAGALQPPSLRERMTRFARRNLTALVAIAAIVAVASIAVVRLGTVTERIPFPPKSKPITAIARDDLTIRGTAIPMGAEPRYLIVLTARDQGLYATLMSAQLTYSIDGGPFEPGTSLTFTFTAKTPPKQVAVKIEGPNGKAGPFTYDLDFQQQVQNQLRQAGAQGGWLSCRRGFHGGIAVCTPARPLRSGSGVRQLHLGTSATDLPMVIDLEDPRKNRGVAYSSTGGRRDDAAYLIPAKDEELWAEAEFSDGTRSEPVRLGSGRSNDREPLFALAADDPEAPALMAVSMSDYRLYADGGLWSLHPIVGEEVREVTWTIHDGGANPAEKYQGFFVVSQKKGSELGATIALDGREAPKLQVTYTYADGATKSYRYVADWKAWAWTIARASLSFDELVRCQSGDTYYDTSISADCFLHIDVPPARVFREIQWGMNPGDLAPLEEFDVTPLKRRFREAEDAYYAQHPEKEDWGKSKRENARNSYEYHLRDRYKRWRELDKGGLILSVTSSVDAIYVKFLLIDGTTSSVVRVPIR